MKKLLKSIIAGILCTAIAITGVISMNTDTAYAASKSTKLTVTLNKKTATLTNDINDALENGIKISNNKKYAKKLTKKWGKYTDFEKWSDSGAGMYTWKKGKSTTTFCAGSSGDGVGFELRSKKDAFCGIKPGTKKATVLKKLKKIVDAEYIHEDVDVSDENADSMIKIAWADPEITDSNDPSRFYQAGYRMYADFVFKNGKLAYIKGYAHKTMDE